MTTTSTQSARTTRRFVGDNVHSTFGFAVRHMGVSLYRGTFSDVTAELEIQADGHATLTGSTAVETISITSPADFRAHILGDDFFAAGSHPTLSFDAARFALPADGGDVDVRGYLTIRGVRREVTAKGTWNTPVDDPFGGVRAALELTAVVDRRDFGITWQIGLPNGGDALGNEVRIDVHLELTEEV